MRIRGDSKVSFEKTGRAEILRGRALFVNGKEWRQFTATFTKGSVLAEGLAVFEVTRDGEIQCMAGKISARPGQRNAQMLVAGEKIDAGSSKSPLDNKATWESRQEAAELNGLP